ncbi:MAG TPA: formate/nitrite transporter family protein [Methylophilaceae bacterium]|nr:formate/nitrite transporter family protein [Methylophilaceae bacterium]HQR60250.1 formate/nitrite transporter family protein [Methylophilaceae bacterium]
MSLNIQQGSVDAYTPSEMAYRVKTVGVAKANMGIRQMVGLGIMAGAFISLGAMNYTAAMAQDMPRLVASFMFCLGLVLVIVGSAELFTGNNLIAMAWAQGKVGTRAVLRNWGWVYLANLLGCLATVVLAYLSGILHSVDLGFGVQALKIAVAKTNIPFTEAFFKGILCNALVCLAVWLCFAARTVVDRIFCILFPISAFVNMGFEHSIANMFFIPMGFLAAADPAVLEAAKLAPEAMAHLNLAGFLNNIVAVTLGNIVGGTVLVAGMYFLVYLYGQHQPHETGRTPTRTKD